MFGQGCLKGAVTRDDTVVGSQTRPPSVPLAIRPRDDRITG
jgi:hypothetical protein